MGERGESCGKRVPETVAGTTQTLANPNHISALQLTSSSSRNREKVFIEREVEKNGVAVHVDTFDSKFAPTVHDVVIILSSRLSRDVDAHSRLSIAAKGTSASRGIPFITVEWRVVSRAGSGNTQERRSVLDVGT